MTKLDALEELFYRTSRGEWYTTPYGNALGNVTGGRHTIYPPCIDVHLSIDGSNCTEEYPDGYVVHPAVADANAEFIAHVHNMFPAFLDAVKVMREVKSMLDRHPQAAVGNTVVHHCACKITGALRGFDD